MKPFPIAQSPLMFVMIAMLGIFLIAMSALLVTSSSRQISAMYIPFAGLYDLALSANERTMLLLNDAACHDEIMIRILELYGDEEIYGEFYAHLFSEYFITKKNEILAEFLRANFGRGTSYLYGEHYFFYYHLTTTTGTYHVRTFIYPQGNAFNLRSRASKNEGPPVYVYGRIQWCEITFEPAMVRTQMVAN